MHVLPALLQLNPQPFGYAIDVGEVGHHLASVVDGPIVEPGGPQFFDVLGGNRPGPIGQQDGEFQKRSVSLGKPRFGEVSARQRLDQFFIPG